MKPPKMFKKTNDGLNSREIFILKHRILKKHMTLEEVGKKYDVTRERIRQDQAFLERKLRWALETEWWGYIDTHNLEENDDK